MPIRIAIGEKSLNDNKVEIKSRASDEVQLVAVDEVIPFVKKLSEELK